MLIFSGCQKGNLQDINLGKDLTITVSENDIIDAEYLQKALDGEIKKDAPSFDLWDSEELMKMIDYMNENNLMLDTGKYTFNQSWKFDNGFLVSGDGEKHEVFSFKQKSN